MHNQDNLSKASMLRLKKDEKMYIEELREFESQLNSLQSTMDAYKEALLLNQIKETKEALKHVQRRLKDFEVCGDM
ncbi:hypothetical protein AAJ76_3700034082 [Vairimorpha ceranae]|uniref:Uncharacterized protein n=1 Tax=Vairimorpha ceranae TaxID=40302 RepID=A0A0F9WBT8_9MICR|nr:hypothetical protein AAJ76_3700034082 [Vairimorpha ceranae]KAF5140778.1 hypothetical protein G9O61_00g010980 [Vairimorpha ceranae]KKO74981.1 hypothetical protein AAJ76_3700034082 [Vairimorpha ceranae]